MSSLLKKVIWYSGKGQETGIELEDIKSINVNRALEGSGNSASITLINPFDFTRDNTAYTRYVDSSTGVLKFKEGDTIKIYVKHITDNTVIDTSASSTDLLMSCEVQEIAAQLSENSTMLTLNCTDKTYVVLNKLWSFAYLKKDSNAPDGGWTSPTMIQNIIQWISGDSPAYQKYTRTGILAINGLYDIDARLKETEGGYIEETRPNQGTGDTDTSLFPYGDNRKFPYITLSNVFKSTYDWIDELSTPDFTNTPTEIDGNTPRCARKYVFYIDQLNRFHWFYPTNAKDYTIISGDFSTSDDLVVNANMKYSTYDIVNMVIYNAGDDMNGAGILDYFFDTTSTSATLKMTYKAWTDIARNIKFTEKSEGDRIGATTITHTQGDVYAYPANYTYYDDSTDPMPHWNPGEDIASNAEFNNSFRDYAVRKGDNRANNFTVRRGSPRWRGSVTVKGRNVVVGNLVELTLMPLGINTKLIRIMSVNHSITNKWTTTLQLEEDEKERGI